MTTSYSVKPTLETNSVHTTDLPTVLLIGTSNIKFIKEDKLAPFAKVIKQIGYIHWMRLTSSFQVLN